MATKATQTRFKKGNQFWKARSSHGPKPKFKKAVDLWNACQEYFEWCEDNPVIEVRPFPFQGKVKNHNVPKMRAMTINGLCIYLDVTHATWIDWRNDRADLLEVITRTEQIIRTQKFAGAAADLLNPNIIARDLGLADKRDLTSTDRTMSPAPLSGKELDKELEKRGIPRAVLDE